MRLRTELNHPFYVGERVVENICVFLFKVELSNVAPRRERCDMHEPPRLRTTSARRDDLGYKDLLYIGLVLRGLGGGV